MTETKRSLWCENAQLPAFAPLETDLRTDVLIMGGGDHRTGKQGGWREMTDFASIHYPRARIRCRWAKQDCMMLDGVPYIGRYSPGTPELYVLTGFNKWA